jgi:hypothetical protein
MGAAQADGVGCKMGHQVFGDTPVRTRITIVAVLLVSASKLLAADQSMDGYWWEKLDVSFKLGWVSGYTKAMDQAAMTQTMRCASDMPIYAKEYPGVDSKVIFQKLCLSDSDYDGITMGQFVEGIDAFYKDYRNRQLEVGYAIQYARDSIKGKPTQDLDAQVALWRRCTAADKSHPLPRSPEDVNIISKACAADAK